MGPSARREKSPYTLTFCPAEEAQAALRAGRVPAALGPAEAALFGTLRTDKRRGDWLAGRLAAKRGIQGRLRVARGVDCALERIEILNEESGRPYCRLPAQAGEPDIPFSISHSARGGLCAVLERPGRIGADWEVVEPRDERLDSLIAHPTELPERGALSPEGRTRLWSLKEAVLKFLGLGLACDPREVRVRGWEPAAVELHGAARRRWLDLGSPEVSCEGWSEGGSIIALAYGG